MLTPLEVFVVFTLVIVALFVYSNMRMKDQANLIAKRFCKRNDLQLLDGTIAVRSIGFAWAHQRIMIRRHYRFEYATNTVNRHHGSLTLLGPEIQHFDVNQEHLSPLTSADSLEKD